VLAGCYFAARLASKSRGLTTVISAVNETTGPVVEAAIDGAAAASEPQIILFPSMRTATEVARLVARLAARRRWSLRRLTWRAAGRASDVPLSLRFTTQAGLTFAAMGLAPLGSMPVTRRAPYVAMVLWGGGHENPHRPSEGLEVGLPDIPTGLSAKKHDELWDKTSALTKSLLADPPEERVLLRNVTFCLPIDVVNAELDTLIDH
jgi:hypothetical protein